MIHLFGIDINTRVKLITEFGNKIRFYSDCNKIKPEENDLVIFSDYRFRKTLLKYSCEMLPSKEMVNLITDRIDQLNILDKITKYPLKRNCYKKFTGKIYLKEGFIYKVGNEHAGNGKYIFPATRSVNVYHDNLIEEEFVKGRSIRVLFLQDDVFFVEHLNENPIKNIDPEEIIIEPIKELLEDALNIKKFLDENKCFSFTLGIDYIYSEEKIGLLEVNDMCGIPEQLQTDFESMMIKMIGEKL